MSQNTAEHVEAQAMLDQGTTPPNAAPPTATPPPLGPTDPLTAADPNPGGDARAGSLTQWQLIRRRFAQHRLAMGALHVLIVLYAVAVFCECVAPRNPGTMNLAYQYCPPQLVQWSWDDGLHVDAMRLTVDPITFRKTYTSLPDTPVRLAILGPGEPYKLWGLIPMERRLLTLSQNQPAFNTTNNDADANAADAAHGIAAEQQVAGGGQLVEPTFYFLGADQYGRDIFSRAVHGARVSLSVGLIGITLTFIFGVTIGGISGYVGGRTDNVIQRGIEILNAFPHLPLWMALSALVPTDWSPLSTYFAITLVLSLLGWTRLARVVRGKILALREEDYAIAARLLGAGHGRILFRHLMPGFTSHIIVALSLAVPAMILAETSLSFLNIGLRPPIVSWGVMLQDCMDIQAVRYYPWLLMPVIFIVATVLAFNFVGDGLRDAADPYSTK